MTTTWKRLGTPALNEWRPTHPGEEESRQSIRGNPVVYRTNDFDGERPPLREYMEIGSLRLYDPAGLPGSWVVENETTGELWIVPAVADGWSRRTPYRGHRAALRPAPGYCFMGLGVPIRRDWSMVCHDFDGRN